MKKYTMSFPAKEESIQTFVSFVSEKLKTLKVERKCAIRTVLSAEELFAAFVAHAEKETEKIDVRVFSHLGQVTIHITGKGTAFELDEIRTQMYVNDLDEEANSCISQMMEKLFGDRIGLTNKYGKNICDIKVSVSSTRMLYLTVLALIGGVACGFLSKTVFPQAVSDFLADNLFSPVSTMFLNALKLIVGPLVFFSIGSSIAGFKNIRTLGQIAIRVVGTYVCTSILAIATGYFIFQMFPIGDSALQAVVSDSADAMIAQSQTVSVSIKSTLVNIIPSNFVNPFFQNDMLQIVFLAVIFGLAGSGTAKKMHGFERFLEDGNALFSRLTEMVIRFLPLAIFCSMAKILISMDFVNAAKVFVCIPLCYLGHLVMIVCYMILLAVVAHLNPLRFMKKFGAVTCIGFCLGSSNATMPYSMECCGKKLGISDRLYSFSIPLGATINMDGSCVSLVVVALFLSRIFGVSVTGSTLLSLCLSILVLSIGAPGVPGVTLICTALLLPQLGVPTEALSIVMGISTLVGLGNCAVNVTGDAAISTIVAKRRNMIDLDVYNS